MDALPTFTLPERPLNSWDLRLLRGWFPPTLIGGENLDATNPVLFIGNHTTYGLLDVPLFQAEVWNASGKWLRGLMDHTHYAVPKWARYLESKGGFRGTRELCCRAMEQGDDLLIFPGGGREVMKRKGEEYSLIWKRRLGFVKLAVANGYPIQPFASVGADDAFDILVDSNDWQSSRFSSLIKKTAIWRVCKDGEEIPPIARGLGLTAIPRPEPFYFVIGEVISTSAYQGLEDDDEAMLALRDQVEAAVMQLIESGKAYQRESGGGAVWRRLLNKL